MFRNKTMLRCAKNVRLASVTPTMAPSGSNWLSQALTDWLSPCLSLAPTGSHFHSLAYSGPLWLTIAL